MSLISIRDLSIRYSGPMLLDGISAEVEPGQRIGLLGRNGAGKSTFLKIISGEVQSDSGGVVVQQGAKIAVLGQDVPRDIFETINEVVSKGVIADAMTEDWKIQVEVDQVLSRMDLDGGARFESLSSGMKRRVLLARALVCKPDVLLLDEPTNHLDMEAIKWLEDFLLRFVPTFIFVTHDRMFLRKMANRILEIDRGKMFDWSCDYDTFLVRKEQALAAQEKENALFDKRLAEEEVWIRKGIKARRTRNEGRVRALKEMRAERSERREKLGTSRLQIQEGQRSGNLVLALDEVSYQYDGAEPVFENFTSALMRGDKIGIIGRNGIGKSTLLKVMLGKLEPTTGKVKLGTNLQIAYFDQLREQLDEEATVQENVGEGNSQIELAGGKKHVLGYLQDFLFTPDRARTQIKFLSGGERNRILLAKLFAKPANLIVLDEPTNDLDSETLDLLEEKLVNYNGTVLVVSHDRAFLNNVVTSTIVFEDHGLNEYVGGYDDWQHQVSQREKVMAKDAAAIKAVAEKPGKKKEKQDDSRDGSSESPARKIKYKEKLELEKLPGQIEALEADIAKLHEQMADSDFYKSDKTEIARVADELKAYEAKLAEAYGRWEELEVLEQ